MPDDQQSRSDDPLSTSPASSGGRNGSGRPGAGGPFLQKLKGLFGQKQQTSSLRESLEGALDEAAGIASDPFSAKERSMLRNVLGLRDLRVDDVMVPGADSESVDGRVRLGELLRLFREAGHSRMPVSRETLDDPIGMVHIKDVLAHLNRGDDVAAGALAREILIVAPSSRALDLLQEMRMTRRHMALVVDEYGGIDGLITIEDLIEEIVGDIVDEHDTEEGPKLSERSDGTIVADARATVEELEVIAGQFLTDDEREEIDTLGGLVFSLAGRVALYGDGRVYVSGQGCELTDPAPEKFALYITDDTYDVQVKSSAEFTGVIYAPTAEVEIQDDAVFFGAVVADEVDVEDDAVFLYDTALRGQGLQ